MSQPFSTDLFPADERLEAWLDYAGPMCGACRFHFPKKLRFDGWIERRSLAGFPATCFSSSPVSFAKFPSVPASGAVREFIIITQLEGTRSYCQKGAIAMLSPGDTTIIDAAEPWNSDCAGHCARLYFRLPHWLLSEHLKSQSVPVLSRILGKHGLGAALSRLATSLYEEAEKMSHDEGSAALGAYLDILAACLSCSSSFGTQLDRCVQLRPRVEHYIERHLEERTLDPPAIAANAGISVRHLHRVFASSGCTVAEWIRERRLERCRQDLVDPKMARITITDIAFRWGFGDSAHFSHSFRKTFGLSPRQFRARAMANPPLVGMIKNHFAPAENHRR